MSDDDDDWGSSAANRRRERGGSNRAEDDDDGGGWGGLGLGRRGRKKQSEEDRMLGVFADDSDDEGAASSGDEMYRSKKARLAKPMAFVSGGVKGGAAGDRHDDNDEVDGDDADADRGGRSRKRRRNDDVRRPEYSGNYEDDLDSEDEEDYGGDDDEVMGRLGLGGARRRGGRSGLGGSAADDDEEEEDEGPRVGLGGGARGGLGSRRQRDDDDEAEEDGEVAGGRSGLGAASRSSAGAAAGDGSDQEHAARPASGGGFNQDMFRKLLSAGAPAAPSSAGSDNDNDDNMVDGQPDTGGSGASIRGLGAARAGLAASAAQSSGSSSSAAAGGLSGQAGIGAAAGLGSGGNGASSSSSGVRGLGFFAQRAATSSSSAASGAASAGAGSGGGASKPKQAPKSGTAFEKHTKGFGAKYLEKFNFSGRLGKHEQGIAQPIAVQVRPTQLGLGFGGFKEANKLKQNKEVESDYKSAKPGAVKDGAGADAASDDEDDDEDGARRRNSAAGAGAAAGPSRAPGAARPPKAKKVYKTAAELLAADDAASFGRDGTLTTAAAGAGAGGGKANVRNAAAASNLIIDMRGPQAKVLTSIDEAGAAAAASGAGDIGDGPYSRIGRELLHNLGLLVDMSESELTATNRKLRNAQSTIDGLRREVATLSSEMERCSNQAEAVQSLHSELSSVIERLRSGVAEVDGLLANAGVTGSMTTYGARVAARAQQAQQPAAAPIVFGSSWSKSKTRREYAASAASSIIDSDGDGNSSTITLKPYSSSSNSTGAGTPSPSTAAEAIDALCSLLDSAADSFELMKRSRPSEFALHKLIGGGPAMVHVVLQKMCSIWTPPLSDAPWIAAQQAVLDAQHRQQQSAMVAQLQQQYITIMGPNGMPMVVPASSLPMAQQTAMIAAAPQVTPPDINDMSLKDEPTMQMLPILRRWANMLSLHVRQCEDALAAVDGNDEDGDIDSGTSASQSRLFGKPRFLDDAGDSLAKRNARAERERYVSDALAAQSHFFSVVEACLVPRLRTAFSNAGWIVKQPRAALALLHSFAPSSPFASTAAAPRPTSSDIISIACYRALLEHSVLPRLASAVDGWDPRSDPVPVQDWTIPWSHPHFLGADVTARLWPPIRFKLQSVLGEWHPSDSSAHTMLEPWKAIWDDRSFDGLLIRAIVPKLAAVLRELQINPRAQYLDPFLWVVAWADLVPTYHFTALLEGEFFPKWFAALASWLGFTRTGAQASPTASSASASTAQAPKGAVAGAAASSSSTPIVTLAGPEPDFDEITQWYLGWKSQFPQNLVSSERVEAVFAKVLDLMNAAMMVDRSDPASVAEAISAAGEILGQIGSPEGQSYAKVLEARRLEGLQAQKGKPSGLGAGSGRTGTGSAAAAGGPRAQAAAKPASAPSSSAAAAEASFKDLVEATVLEAGLSFLPNTARAPIDGCVVYKIGGVNCYINHGVVFAATGTAASASFAGTGGAADANGSTLAGYRPVSLDALIEIAKAKR